MTSIYSIINTCAFSIDLPIVSLIPLIYINLYLSSYFCITDIIGRNRLTNIYGCFFFQSKRSHFFFFWPLKNLCFLPETLVTFLICKCDVKTLYIFVAFFLKSFYCANAKFFILECKCIDHFPMYVQYMQLCQTESWVYSVDPRRFYVDQFLPF